MAGLVTKTLRRLPFGEEMPKLGELLLEKTRPMAIRELLEDALKEPTIGITPCFRWHATPVGIAALWSEGQPPASPPFEAALKEGLQVGLDLSREEREFHQVKSGLVLLFHS